MNIKLSFKSETIKNQPDEHGQKDKIDSMIEYVEAKIKQIHKRISENEVKLESMESHSD